MGILTWLRGDDLVETRDVPGMTLTDPALAEYLGLAGANVAGVAVTERSSLGLTALWRAVSLISGAIAGLPLKTYRDTPDGRRERVSSFLDEPAGPDGLTRFEWVELVMVHLLLHGNAFLVHQYGGAGQLVGLVPAHPGAVTVKVPETADEKARFGDWPKMFVVRLANGRQLELSPGDLTHIPALSTDGLRGISPIEAHRQAIGTGLAGDQAAARMFGSGMLIGGMVSANEDLAEEDAQEIVDGIKAKTAGSSHAGDIAFINAQLTFTPWTVPAKDAQFLESRVHQVEEVGRIYGIPDHLMGLQQKQTSWGTGVAEQNRGLARYTLMSWTSRLEQRLSRLLPRPRFVEFDYSGFLQPSPEVEIPLLIQQVQAGLLTPDEARAIRNLPPLDDPEAPDAGDETEA